MKSRNALPGTVLAYILCALALLVAGVSPAFAWGSPFWFSTPPPVLDDHSKIEVVYDEAQDYLESKGFVFIDDVELAENPSTDPLGLGKDTYAAIELDTGYMVLSPEAWDDTVTLYDTRSKQLPLDSYDLFAVVTALHEPLHVSAYGDYGNEGLVEAVAMDNLPGFLSEFAPYERHPWSEVQYLALEAYPEEVQDVWEESTQACGLSIDREEAGCPVKWRAAELGAG